MKYLRRLAVLVPALALVWAGVGLMPHGTHAFDGWCFDDPVVQVNNTTAAIAVGLQSSPSEVASTIWTVYITVHVPAGARTRVIASTHQYFTEVTRFVPTDDPSSAGDVDVRFDMAHGNTPKSAAVQITTGGQTTTTTGKTHQGLHAHFTIH